MKVGVVTHSFGFNYGGTLQCFALLSVLKEQGYDAEYVDYRPGEGSFKKRVCKKIFSRLLPKYRAFTRRLQVFDAFRSANCPKSPAFRSFDEVKSYSSRYDACVVGSDQVWNPRFSGSSAFYMLEQVLPARRVAYAASFGVEKLEEKRILRYATALREFTAISTRETSGAALVESLGLPRPAVSLDPTMLADSAHWRAWMSAKSSERRNSTDSANSAEEYVCVYALKGLAETRECLGLARKVAEKIGVRKVVLIASDCPVPTLKKNFPDVPLVENANPFEFVELIANASFVVTNSFHGSVFSILFHRKFYSVLESSKDASKRTNSRLVDLFNTLGVSERIKSASDDFDVTSCPDYADVDRRLSELRAGSLDYLNAALQKTQNAKEPKLCERDKCLGCAACANKCPKKLFRCNTTKKDFGARLSIGNYASSAAYAKKRVLF